MERYQMYKMGEYHKTPSWDLKTQSLSWVPGAWKESSPWVLDALEGASSLVPEAQEGASSLVPGAQKEAPHWVSGAEEETPSWLPGAREEAPPLDPPPRASHGTGGCWTPVGRRSRVSLSPRMDSQPFVPERLPSLEESLTRLPGVMWCSLQVVVWDTGGLLSHCQSGVHPRIIF